MKKNPSSTCRLKLDNVNGQSIFKRIYLCLNACKEGLNACKEGFKWLEPFVRLDGCHLKGTCRCQLLSAIGRDPNK